LPFARCPDASEAQLDRAVAAARRAFKDWSHCRAFATRLQAAKQQAAPSASRPHLGRQQVRQRVRLSRLGQVRVETGSRCLRDVVLPEDVAT
jgi:hypothetical protein